MRRLLVIGMIARQTQENKRRRTGKSANGKSLIDPILRAQIHNEERNILIAFLKKNRKRSYSAAELSKNTGVPKIRVRQLLDISGKISVIGHGGRFVFQSRPPKRKRIF